MASSKAAESPRRPLTHMIWSPGWMQSAGSAQVALYSASSPSPAMESTTRCLPSSWSTERPNAQPPGGRCNRTTQSGRTTEPEAPPCLSCDITLAYSSWSRTSKRSSLEYPMELIHPVNGSSPASSMVTFKRRVPTFCVECHVTLPISWTRTETPGFTVPTGSLSSPLSRRMRICCRVRYLPPTSHASVSKAPESVVRDARRRREAALRPRRSGRMAAAL
mmetsp:Transcript_32285/g.97567  ORF Transcript_32285/g.97567 Transcript_32285/m.97567 type:complete len:220 (+) Transcript_32285:238-897(+)